LAKAAHLFKKGNVANPAGRPKGSKGKHTVELRTMVSKALDKAGGVKYLVQQAEANPSAFMALVAKTMPQKMDIDVRMISSDMISLMHERRDAIAQTIEHHTEEEDQ